MPERASIVYFCYHGKTQFTLESYEYVEDGVFKYGNEIIKTSLLMRIKAIYDKLIQGFLRGDTEFLSKLYLYIPNLLLGTTKVK